VLGRNEHAENDGLVAILRARLARQSDDADQRPVDEGAVDDVVAVRREAGFRPRERLRPLFVKARREGVGVLGESAQPQLAVGGGVGGEQAPDRDSGIRRSRNSVSSPSR
jgi:hypothetical protein